jgi:peptidoglycan/xylan/chitin deacetylase (PgdA/CDA1 family)
MRQYVKLKAAWNIVMWDLMPYDFDNSFGPARSLDILKRKIRKGSIIALHDSPVSNFDTFLGEFISYSISEGYKFVLPPFSKINL